MSDEERIRRRHPDIKQESLFTIPKQRKGKRAEKPQSVKSIRQAKCPHCCGKQGSNKKVGVIRSGTAEIFRDHDKFTIAGRRIPCAGSRTEAPPA